MNIKIGPYQLEVDLPAMEELYAGQAEPTCTCPYCTNFRHSVGTASGEIREFFRSLGIAPEKPWSIWGIYNHNGETELYGGYYKLIGTIVEGKDPWESLPDGGFGLKEGYELQFEDGLFAHFETECRSGSPEEGVFWMEVTWDLPWLLRRNHRG